MSCPACFNFRVDGRCVAGILHGLRAARRCGCCAVILSGPGTTRSGPHDLLVRIAERLARDGICAARFDYRGRGESEGEDQELTVDTMFEDARGCCRRLTGLLPSPHAFVIVAMCMGAVAGIKLMEMTPTISHAVLLGAPQYDPVQATGDRARYVRNMLGRYVIKGLRPTSWLRLAAGRVDVRAVRRAVWGKRDKYQPPRAARLAAAGAKGPPGPSKRLLLLYGRYDASASGCIRYYRRFLARRGWRGAVAMIDSADRTFSGQAGSVDVVRAVREYVRLALGMSEFGRWVDAT